MRRATVFAIVTMALAVVLSACAYTPRPAAMSTLPIYPNRTPSERMLNDLPPPEHAIAVAVYDFSDQTGQFKMVAAGETLSRAVSQGSSAMLIHSLRAAGDRSWFTIVERERLRDLLNERQLIREMRGQYLGEKTVNPQALPPLLFAGVLLEGGVVGYDTNTVTGGLGATWLGIGGDAKYQQDTVTVYLRAVSVKTGEVLTSVTASKTITSYAIDANVFRYIGSNSLLETEDGFTTNEPAMLALQEAIDKAVYGLIMQGVNLRLWNFADPKAGWPALWRYDQEREGFVTAQEVVEAERAAHHGWRPVREPTPPPRPSPAPHTAAAQPAMNAPARNPAGTSASETVLALAPGASAALAPSGSPSARVLTIDDLLAAAPASDGQTAAAIPLQHAQ